MCGIFGIVARIDNNFSKKDYRKCLDALFIYSESRGKEASGFALRGKDIKYLKTPEPASELIKNNSYVSNINHYLESNHICHSAIGHSRLVTNGYEQENVNNQPVAKKGIVAVHNGIIINDKELWSKYSDEYKQSQLDSELIPTIIGKYYDEQKDLVKSISKFYNQIRGISNIAFLHSSVNGVILSTNNGSLYYITNKDNTVFVFASERYILNKLIDENFNSIFEKKNVCQLLPNQLLIVDESIDLKLLDFKSKEIIVPFDENNLKTIELKCESKSTYSNTSLNHTFKSLPTEFENEIAKRKLVIRDLMRCARCVLPETFPFIDFNDDGVCNYCENHKPLKFYGKKELKNHLGKFKSSSNVEHDCLVPFSGGRDSSYVMHLIKKEYEMNPIAFSYDWGMLTDLARRNQSLMCSELGIEHILISADIRKKRKNIRKNILAWLKRPSLGTIPLFMAGDKQYFYYSNLLMKQNKLNLSIMGENMLETTRFKTGFCGVKPNFYNEKTYSLSPKDKVKMLTFYGKEFLLNTSYFNSSLLDTLDAFKSYYIMGHNSINIFDYIPWVENEVDNVLINQYGWETDPGTKTTWRIGDGTAAFYNYIYYMVAGFTENDTFRSNQIREGLISRKEALMKIEEENNVRWDSIQWYCNTIGLDWERTIKIINNIPTLY